MARWRRRTQVCSNLQQNPGVKVAKEVDKAFTANLAAALGLHRVWDRAAKVMSSAVPPTA